MKKIYLLLIAIFASFYIAAQTPQAFKYQAIARDEAGNILSNWNISISISILKGGQDGTDSYSEIHRVRSNSYGMITLSIGEGENITGDFKNIDWGGERFFIKMEMDINGGENYKEMGTTQLYAVPYALYAEEAGHLKQQEPAYKNAEPISHAKRTQSGSGSRDTPNSKISSSGNSWLNLLSGNLGIGTNTPSASALMEISSDNKGFLPPRMTTGQMLAISSPAEGLTIYNTTLKTLFYFNGLRWSNSIDGKSCGIIDYDGQIYKTVIIGYQCWMAENLNIGAKINSTTGGQEQKDNEEIEKYCYDNNESQCNIYGGLYEWGEAMQYETAEGSQGICPDGWHIPTDEEWKILEGTVDSYYPVGNPEWDGISWRGLDAGGNLKETGTTLWNPPNTGATNSSGFTCLPGGYRLHSNGSFSHRSLGTNLWSSTENTTNAWYYYMGSDNAGVYRNQTSKIFGFSVRCLQD